MQKIDIKSMSIDELVCFMKNFSLRPFHARQVFSWLSRGVLEFNSMTDISLNLRKILNEKCSIKTVKILKKSISKDGTVKYLFELDDAQRIESVLMEYNHGYTLCISTQAGCKMGCVFCATGKNGFARNLTPSEMLAQIQVASEDFKKRISNVVLMGMGEPLDNFENTLKFLEIATHELGLNIGKRHISVSTCGLVDKIYDLANRNLRLSLTVSLHAPNDRIRNLILKVNKKHSINSLLEACKHYTKVVKKRITFVYTMIHDLNDKPSHAKELSEKLKGISCLVNLIPLNQIEGEKFKRSDQKRTKEFCDVLVKNKINVTTRRTLGSDINASCGQLAFKKLTYKDKKEVAKFGCGDAQRKRVGEK